MRPIEHRHLPAILRLVVVEAMPFYIFYASFSDVLVNLWSFCYLWSLPAPTETISPGKFNYKVLNDLWTAIFIPEMYFKGEVVVLHHNYAGLINYGCLLICMFGIGYQAWVTLVRGGFDACSGRYMASKWNADQSTVYRSLAALMGLYLLVTITVSLIAWEVEYRMSEIMDFLFYRINPIIVIIANAFVLAHHHVPEFDYETEEFAELRFHRDWVDLLLQPSSIFMSKLESALLHAHAGNINPLRELLEFEQDVPRVLEMCTFPDDEDSEPVDTKQKLADHVIELMG